MDRQTGRYTDGRQVDKIDRLIDEVDKVDGLGRWRDRLMDRLRERERERARQRDGQIGRQID